MELKDYKYIIDNCENKINNAIWLLEMKKYNIKYEGWENVLDNIISMITNTDNYTTKKIFEVLKKIRASFYILFITNIDIKEIIRKLMFKLIETQENLVSKLQIIEITSLFESRIVQGTRYIIHLEAFINRILLMLYKINTNDVNDTIIKPII